MTMVSNFGVQKSVWRPVVLLTLLFWISSSLLLDLVIMPVLYTSGMMAERGFASTGYSLFWIFNRIELLCAALIFTGILSLRQVLSDIGKPEQRTVFLASLALAVVLLITYGLAPQMSGLGLQLNLFNPAAEPPALMNSLHAGYWLLELLKLSIGGILLRLCWNSFREVL